MLDRSRRSGKFLSRLLLAAFIATALAVVLLSFPLLPARAQDEPTPDQELRDSESTEPDATEPDATEPESGEPELKEPEPIPTEDCLECHEQEDLDMEKPDGTTVSIFVDVKILASSVHEGFDCADCHEDLTAEHPDDEVPAKAVNCAECHEEQSEAYVGSIHGVSRAMGESAASSCTDCHGKHDMLGSDNPNSPTFKLNLSRTCAKCHANEGITDEYRMKYPDVASQYRDSIHGHAVLEMGLVVAPSCNDCHGVHDIKRGIDRSAPINRAHIAETCGECHLGIEETYNKSVHGKLLLEGNPDAPVCFDCHSAHQIETHNGVHFKEASDRSCGKCHAESLKHYRDTYHGKAMALGRPNVAPDVAACYDCHGFHDILPSSDPDSRLSPGNIVGTCRECHSHANAGFTKYIPHADPMDGDRYPALHLTFVFMTSLLLGVFAFFGGHTLLWMARSAWLWRTDSKTFREAKRAGHHDDECFSRFTPFQRFLHMLVVTSFLLLVITGMPLKFYYADWAKTMFALLGGVETARALHHFGAIVSFLYFGLHLLSLAVSFWKKRDALRDPETGKWSLRRLLNAAFGPDSMVPSLQDLKDFIAHQKWFFGKGPKPQFDRWTYWEKFDYFAVFWGMCIIGLSGLVMWFPQFFTSFLPGWVINIALIVHSDEALLAAGFIFTVHFFNTHFRLERFPMDKVIFSGRVSKVEMRQERLRWYERLKDEGKLDQHRIGDEWQSWKKIIAPIGYLFLTIGLILLGLIIYAMILHLT